MDAEEAVRKYPELRGLYIPHAGEVINYGKAGTAICTQSPLDDGQPLMVITLNAPAMFDPFRINGEVLMGPYEALSLAEQVDRVNKINRLYDGRFLKLFQKHPEVEDLWNKYRRPKKYA